MTRLEGELSSEKGVHYYTKHGRMLTLPDSAEHGTITIILQRTIRQMSRDISRWDI